MDDWWQVVLPPSSPLIYLLPLSLPPPPLSPLPPSGCASSDCVHTQSGFGSTAGRHTNHQQGHFCYHGTVFPWLLNETDSPPPRFVLAQIDLRGADVVGVTRQICDAFGADERDILTVSAKTGQHVSELLQEVVQRVPR